MLKSKELTDPVLDVGVRRLAGRYHHVAPRSLFMNYAKGMLAVVLLLLVLVLAIQNRAGVDVSFLFWSFRSPKVLLILGTYLLGMITGFGVVELIKKAF
jgi:uncharacterized integral membrane protein